MIVVYDTESHFWPCVELHNLNYFKQYESLMQYFLTFLYWLTCNKTLYYLFICLFIY